MPRSRGCLRPPGARSAHRPEGRGAESRRARYIQTQRSQLRAAGCDSEPWGNFGLSLLNRAELDYGAGTIGRRNELRASPAQILSAARWSPQATAITSIITVHTRRSEERRVGK